MKKNKAALFVVPSTILSNIRNENSRNASKRLIKWPWPYQNRILIKGLLLTRKPYKRGGSSLQCIHTWWDYAVSLKTQSHSFLVPIICPWPSVPMQERVLLWEMTLEPWGTPTGNLHQPEILERQALWEKRKRNYQDAGQKAKSLITQYHETAENS